MPEYRVGTRSSPLARTQAGLVIRQLREVRPEALFTLVPILTKGDRNPGQPLSAVGGKGLFTEELEAALREGAIDLAVHSMKDMVTRLPSDFTVAAVMARSDPRDAFISLKSRALRDLPEGAHVGTASLRRQAWIKMKRPDIKISLLRGNIQSRLDKIRTKQIDATLLAMAGLIRLRIDQKPFVHPISTDALLPAPAQGAVAVECCRNRTDIFELLAPLHDVKTALCVAAERACLDALDGSCQTAIGCYARMTDDNLMHFRGCIYQETAPTIMFKQPIHSLSHAESAGRDAGEKLRAESALKYSG